MPSSKEFFGLVPSREERQSVEPQERAPAWPLLQSLSREDQPAAPRLSDAEREAAWSVPEDVELPEVVEDEQTRADLLAEGLLKTRLAARNDVPEPQTQTQMQTVVETPLPAMQSTASATSARTDFMQKPAFVPAPDSVRAAPAQPAPVSRPAPLPQPAPAPVAAHPHNPFAKPAPAPVPVPVTQAQAQAQAQAVEPMRTPAPSVADPRITPAMPSPPTPRPSSTPSSLSALFRRISGAAPAAPAADPNAPSTSTPPASASTALGFLTRLGRK